MSKDTAILIRVTKEEKAHFNAMALAAGVTISVWIRESLRVASGYGLKSVVLRESSPPDPASAGELLKRMKISPAPNEEPKTDTEFEEIPLATQSEPGPSLASPSGAQGEPSEPRIESGMMLDGVWVPD